MSATNPPTLLAVYDFAAAPYTFDFFAFLVACEAERRRLALDAIHLVLIAAPGPADNPGANIKRDEQVWRLHNLIMPGTALLPSIARVSVCTERAEAEPLLAGSAHVFPLRYTLAHPVGLYETAELTTLWARGIAIPSLSVPEPAKTYVRQYLDARAKGRRVVTITLRQTSYTAERNSNVQGWVDFAAGLDTEKYLAVFLPDMQNVFDPPDPLLAPFTVFGEATANLLIRAALYELAFVNLFRSNGPANLAFFNHAAPLLNFVIPVAHAGDQSVHAIRGGTGIEIGTQFPYFQPRQKWAWRDDTADNIAVEFAAFEAFAEGRIAPEDFRSNAMDDPRAIAGLLSRADRPTQAREIYEHLLATGGYDPDIALAVAKLDNERGAHAAALERLRDLTARGQTGFEIDEQLGDALGGLRNVQPAAEAYRSALTTAALAPGVRIRIAIKLGYLLAAQGRLDEAQDAAEAALSGTPHDRLVLQFVGELWSERGQTERAAPYIAREIDLLRLETDAASALRLCRLYNQIARFADALTLARELDARGDARFQIDEVLGDALAGLGRRDEAREHYQRGIALTWGRHGPLLFKLACLQVELGDLAAAERSIRACIDVQDTHGPAYELLARILAAQNRTQESLQVLIRARELAMR